MELKSFVPQDIDTVFAIQQAAYRPLFDTYQDADTSPYMEPKEKMLEKYGRAHGYLFLDGGQCVGCVRIYTDEENKKGRVSALAVHPDFQGQGIAQTAMKLIEQKHSNIKSWYLDTILQEKGNCHLYEKLGYVATGTRELKPGMTLVFYEKHT